MRFQVYVLAGYGGLVPHGPDTVGASIFHQTNGFRCPAPTLPGPANPLSRPRLPL